MTTFLKVKNRAVSSLASGISDTDTSLTVASGEGSKFPSSYPFHITIDDEILSCTNRSTDTLTVARAAESTSAAAHSAGAVVSLNITAKLLDDITGAVGTLEGASHTQNTDKQIKDADADTIIQVEESSDEDKIRMDVGGTEAFYLSDVGILTLAKQSGALIKLSGAQQMANNQAKCVLAFDTEDFDNQNEFDGTRKTGTADATEANKLHDADGGFSAADVGKTVWNTTDETYTTVSAFVDSGELTLEDDIMVNGEGYHLYFSRFTATEAGKYLVVLTVVIDAVDDGEYFSLTLDKNNVLFNRLYFGAAASGAYLPGTIALVMTLAANDYLHGEVYLSVGQTEEVRYGETAFTILKLL